MMSGIGGAAKHLRAKLARSFPAARLYISNSLKQKDVLPGRTGEMGFPPKGVPPLESTFLP